MTEFFDALETRSADEREAAQMAALAGQLAHAQRHSTALAEILKDVDPASVASRPALAKLPVTRKSELLERQKASRAAGGDAFGGFSALVRGPAMSRIFASPGRFTSPRVRGPTTGARVARCTLPVFEKANWCTTPSATT